MVILLSLSLWVRAGELSPLPFDQVKGPLVEESQIAALLDELRKSVPTIAEATVVKSTASSHSSWHDVTYAPSNVADRDFKTAWVEGVKGYGVGEWLRLEVDAGDQKIFGLVILPGYTKNPTMWRNNSSPRVLQVELLSGEERIASFRVRLERTRRAQIFRFDPALTKLPATCTLLLTIESAHSGKRFRDTAIAEVRVLTY